MITLKSDSNGKIKLEECIREHFGETTELYIVALSSYFGIYNLESYENFLKKGAEMIGNKAKALRFIGRISAQLDIDAKGRIKVPREFISKEGDENEFCVVPRQIEEYKSIIISPRLVYEKRIAPFLAESDVLKYENKGEREDEEGRRKD